MEFVIIIIIIIFFFPQVTTALKDRLSETQAAMSVQVVTTAPLGPVCPRSVTPATTKTWCGRRCARNVQLDSTVTTLLGTSPPTPVTSALKVRLQ